MRRLPKGTVELGPLFVGLFDGPEIVVAWRQVIVWQWRANA